MFDFHSDTDRYFQMQEANCREYVIPFIESSYVLQEGMRVLEIGCAEAGVLKAFLDRGCVCVGVELYAERLENGAKRLSEYIERGQLSLVAKDIYKVDPEKDFGEKFDIIVLKDVIEHIHDQEKLIAWMQTFLRPGGVIFFGFPPWQMPFGGHQQVLQSKFLSRLPYLHLLPAPIYRYILKSFGEGVEEFMEIKETGISIEYFEKIVHKTGYRILDKLHYLINPIYQYKFNLKGRKQYKVISSIPYIRNFFTTCTFYLISEKKVFRH